MQAALGQGQTGGRISKRGEVCFANRPECNYSFTMRIVSLGVALVLMTAAGCAVSPMVETARKPDYPKLAKEIEAAQKSGELSDGDVEDIALAIAEVEIRQAKDAEGEQLLLVFGGCAEQVEGELSDRFDKGDDLGAVAGQLLLSSGVVNIDEYVDLALDGDPRPAYKALGARGLIDSDDFGLRRQLYLDLDERVRMNSLRAAMSAPAPEDFDALVEAGRVDPYPAARAAAVRALGRIGGNRATVALKDLWLRADGRLKESIVDAYVASPTFEAGGREELVRIAESGGAANIAAAIALSRLALNDPKDRAANEVAMGVLVRAIKLGTREDRTFAMLMAPTTDVVLEALREAKKDTDAGVALIALGRLAQVGDEKEQKEAREKLLEIAKSDDSDKNRAMGELATLQDQRVVVLLEKELTAEAQFARAYAARHLVNLGEQKRAARLLADPQSYVRATVACAVLAHDE